MTFEITIKHVRAATFAAWFFVVGALVGHECGFEEGKTAEIFRALEHDDVDFDSHCNHIEAELRACEEKKCPLR